MNTQTFFTSDTHFGHSRIIDLAWRPFRDVPHMNEELIARWNSVVRPEDTIFHLGDVALGPWVEWDSVLTRLNGHKVLIVGNHDRIFKGQPEKQQRRFVTEYAKWFDEIQDEYSFTFEDGTVAALSHFPYSGDSHGAERYREFRLRDDGIPLVHGHTHEGRVITRSNQGTLQVHVGVDAHNFTPVSETQVLEYINRGQECCPPTHRKEGG